MKAIDRINAIATKEWRLNLRFPLQYFAANLIGPLKSSVLMILLYGGFLKSSQAGLGQLNGENYLIYVILGTTCHSLFSSSLSVFADKMIMEKWWQTVTATLVSPASALEVMLGYVIGSGGMQFVIALLFLILGSLLYPVTFQVFLLGIVMLVIVALLGFGVGLIGALLRLCFEGKSFLFDYGIQGLIFLSCFYYPVEIIPEKIRWMATITPTYQASHFLHRIYLSGFTPDMAPWLMLLLGTAVVMVIVPAILLDYSIRKFGIVGY